MVQTSHLFGTAVFAHSYNKHKFAGRLLAVKFESEDIVTFNGKFEFNCHRYFSARTTPEKRCETNYLYSSDGVGQRSAMTPKPIPTLKGYFGVLRTC